MFFTSNNIVQNFPTSDYKLKQHFELQLSNLYCFDYCDKCDTIFNLEDFSCKKYNADRFKVHKNNFMDFKIKFFLMYNLQEILTEKFGDKNFRKT